MQEKSARQYLLDRSVSPTASPLGEAALIGGGGLAFCVAPMLSRGQVGCGGEDGDNNRLGRPDPESNITRMQS